MAQGNSEKAQPKRKHESTGRAKTGAIFGIVVLACVLASDVSTVVLIAVISAFCAFELCALLRYDAKLPNEWIAVVCAALYPIVYVMMGVWGVLLLTLMLMAVALGWYVAYPRARITDIGVTVFSAIYTGLMPTSLVMIRLAAPGIWGGVLATAVIFAVWANDVMAYVWGSRLGRHRMAPRISPKKSWEGCVAGIIGSIMIWIVMCYIPGVNLPLYQAIIGGLVSGVFAVLGDLAESRIKRAAGKKDSGKILPGHGGLLDRCDAMILGSAASVFCLIIFGVVTL